MISSLGAGKGMVELAWGQREQGASTDLGEGPQSQSCFPTATLWSMAEAPFRHGQPVPAWRTALQEAPGPQRAWGGPGWEWVWWDQEHGV